MTSTDAPDRITSLREHARRLIAGSGGGDDGAIGERVTRVETHMEYVRRDLHDLKSGQEKVLAKLDGLSGGQSALAQAQSSLPTRRDLQADFANIVVIGLAILAIPISGIVGGLAVINHYAAADASPSSIGGVPKSPKH